MKRLILMATIVCSCFFILSFTKKGFDPLEITVKIAENTYLDRAEIRNIHWREYMSWTANKYGKESNEYLACIPEPAVWAGKDFEKMKDHYLNHAIYNNYPVVGISHAQAVAYCNWRADRINEVLGLRKKKTNVTYSCRLPTKAEWEKLANSEMISNDVVRTDLNNLQFVNEDGTIKESEITVPVESYTPTLNGYYNLVGNVAEMVAEKGIAKGASWQHLNTDFSVEKDYTYDGPTNWLGFRCVLVRH